ncbi:MAG: class B sortase [Clostridia bacterium]
MKKILIKIINNTLLFKEKVKLNNENKNLLNTNVINCNEILFSDEYIIENIKIVSSFINELCKSQNIDTVEVINGTLNELVIDILKNNSYVTGLKLKSDLSLTFKICEKLIKTNITSLECYNLQTFMLEYLDKHGILVESRNEILFLSNFMIENKLSIYSSIFYKMSLHLDLPFTEQDEEDFETFCKINKYLKTIHVTLVSRSDLENIVDILKNNNKKNIKIIIHDNISDIETIEYLKNYNKRYSKRYKIYFKLSYSDAYLSENMLKQTNVSILKICGSIILLIIVVTFGYVFYDNYASMQNVNDIKDEINKVVEIADTDKIIEDIISKEENKEKVVINNDIASLLSINPDVIGWIKVNNTNVDYPLLQSFDNAFYLNHNIKSEYDLNGWPFMDYRNSIDPLSDNILLFGHNRYYSGVMFGTLQNTTRYSWYTNEENQIISLRTMFNNYKYKIFSIYKIYKTNDYFTTNFADDEARYTFYNKLKVRSIYDFKVQVSGNDKILTLSTCADNDNRIVIHAVLQKDDLG